MIPLWKDGKGESCVGRQKRPMFFSKKRRGVIRILSGREYVQVFYPLLIYVLPLEIQLSRGEGWDPINRFNSATFLCLSQARTWISNVICWHSCGLFCVQWVHLCYFCWYWWNWWPSLFKLSFHIPPHLGISFHSCLEPCRPIKITSLTCSPYWY